MQPDWEVWLDTNISPVIAKWMAEHTGVVVKSSYSLQLHYLSDRELYDKARLAGKVIIISKDADIPALINRLGAPPKVINLRIGNCDNKQLWARIQPFISEAIKLLAYTEVTMVEID